MHAEQLTEFRVAVIDPESLRIVTARSAAGPVLFRESVPRYARTAEALTDALERHHGLHTIQLALLPKGERQTFCAVHELILQTNPSSRSICLNSPNDSAPADLTDKERDLICRIMRGQAHELGRFARLGWIRELFEMLGLKPSRDTLSSLRQINQGIDFCLLSFRDSSGAVWWFKAVGAPNTAEFAFTTEIARRFPAFLPRILATFPNWNAWVIQNIEGVPLDRSDQLQNCEDALAALATMQIEIASDVRVLSALGAQEWTCSQIASLSEPFFVEARRAMEAQASTASKPLTDGELCVLQDDLQSALRQFADSPIPETLIHGDIGHGNVLATSDGPVFLDWAETYIGHPFICAEHLLADLIRSNQIFAKNQSLLRSFYVRQWNRFVDQAGLERIAALAPAIAAYEYALVTWKANQDRRDPTLVWPLLRSMLRRTRRELEHLAEVTA